MLRKVQVADAVGDLAFAPRHATILVPTAGGYVAYKFIDNEWVNTTPLSDSGTQAHTTAPHAPADAQKNSDITKAEIEAKLTGVIGSHSHPGSGNPVEWDDVLNKPASFPPSAHNHDGSYAALGHTHNYEPANSNIQTHIGSTNNPHGTTKAHVGLGSVDNTSDASKPVSTAQAAADAAVKACIPNASYRTILDSTGSHIAGRVAGTYGLGQGDPLAITGTGTLYPLNTIYIDSGDFPTVDGKAPKLRIRAQLYTNDVAPTGNYTIGLHPITRPAASGGAGLCIYTIGVAVAGSTVVFTAPTADGLHNQAGADFALPANGHYVIGLVSTATVAANAHIHISASLQMRNN